MIGDQNTGKTSIIHRYVYGQFRDRYEVTVGAGINLKEIDWDNQYNVTVEFLDIGGNSIKSFDHLRNDLIILSSCLKTR